MSDTNNIINIDLSSIYNYYFIPIEEDNTEIILNAEKNFISKKGNTIYINSKKINLFFTEENVNEYIEKTISKSEKKGYLFIFIENEKNSNFIFEIKLNNKKTYRFNYTKTFLWNENETHYYNNLPLNSDRSSFMLLRTNPKLTGNIKLVVDSNNKMYLDTFKINSTLSNNLYRHKQISYESSYSNDIRNVFSSIPKRELYEVPENAFGIFDIKDKLSQQYNDTYFYGVKNNEDNLYSENFSLLAPLYLNEELPDFFLIFKLNGPRNENDNINITSTPTDKLKRFLIDGEIIKTFDLRSNSPIGKYLRKIVEENKKHPSSVFVSYNDYVPNKWNGISIDRGIVNSVNESCYMLSQVNNQVEYDHFITNGFERNGLINSHLINLEFMFNDENGEDFSINRYFGLYVSNITLNRIYYKDKIFYNADTDEKIDNINNIINPNGQNIIINLTDSKNDYIRVKQMSKIKECVKKTDYKNIYSSYYSNIDILNNVMMININNPLKAGEHLKIIDTSNNEVYEVILGKVDKEKYTNIEDYYNYENFPIENYNDDIKVYRNIAPGYDDLDNNIFFDDNENDIIKKQIYYIKKSFDSILPSDIKITLMNNNIYFESSKKLTFERISSEIIYELNEKNLSNYNINPNKDITYFNEEIPYIILNSANEDKKSKSYIFQPLNFETWYNRIAYIVDFIDIKDGNKIYNYKYYNIPKNNYKNLQTNNTLVKVFNEKNNKTYYRNVVPFNLYYYDSSTLSNDMKLPIKKITLDSNKEDNFFIRIDTQPKEKIESAINFFSIAPFELNISGILPIRDFNFNVIDNNNYFEINNKIQKIKGTDTYDSFYNIEKNSAFKIDKLRKENTSCENIFNYFTLIDNNTNTYNTFSFYDVINKYYNESKRKMDIPLVVSTNCKWKMYGKDVLNEKIKSTIFYNNISNSFTTYRLSKDNNILFGFPCVSDNKMENKLYLSCDFLSMRDSILNKKANIYQVVNDINKFTKLFYNFNNNSLETIFFGNKLSIKDKNLNVEEYDKFLFTIICVPNFSIRTTPFEMIIDKNNKMILGVWYFGTNNTSLSYRNKFNNKYNFVKLNSNASLKNLYNKKEMPFELNDCDTNKILNKNIFISALNDNDYYSVDNQNLTFYIEDASISNKSLIPKNEESLYMSTQLGNFNVSSTTFLNTTNNVNTFLIMKNENEKNSFKDIIEKNNTFNVNTFISILKNNVNCFVIDDKLYSYTNGTSITIEEPQNITETLFFIKNKQNLSKDYFAYNGYIQPEFVDIVNFKHKTSLIVNDVSTNFYNSNLLINNVNNIEQLWINKVYDNINSYNVLDSSIKLSFDVINNVDVTRTSWDDNFFIKYENDKTSYVNGYENKEDVKSFFGSHGIVLKSKEFVISEWDGFYDVKRKFKNFNLYDDNKNKYEITFDITSALSYYINTHTNIKKNWAFNKNAILYASDYVNNLVNKFYNINNKNTLEIYRRQKRNSVYGPNIDKYVITKYEENANFERVNNVDIELYSNNNKYYLKMTIPIDDNEYAIKYTIIR